MHRKILIETDLHNIKKLNHINNILNDQQIKNGMSRRNTIVDIKQSVLDSIKLYGYDKQLKYETTTISYDQLFIIFDKIDKMPIRKSEIDNLIGGDMNLYTDNHPETTLKGTGFKDKKMALKTIKLITKRSMIYQKSVINTLYNRAKYHPNKTLEMNEAMKIFKQWLTTNNNVKRKYEYLDLDIVKKYEKLANHYDISHVARGLKKASKSDDGFLVVYKRVKGNKNKLSYIPIFRNKPEGLDYDIFREKFLNSRLGQIKHAGIKLYNDDGLPTKQHTILIMYGYSPDSSGLKKKLHLLDKL